jgi:hypothetical protein
MNLYKITIAVLLYFFYMCVAVAQDMCTEIDRSKWNKCKGEYFFKSNEDGRTYKIISFFENGVSVGSAEIIYSDQSKYKGEILNGKREGKGIFYLINGLRQIGNWKNDKLNGQGLELSKDGKIVKDGIWRNGELLDSKINNNLNNIDTKYLKEFKEIVVNNEKGCKFLFYARHEDISNLKNPKLTWNGECLNGYLDGRGEVNLKFDKLVEYKFIGEFKKGKLFGFVEGSAIFEGYNASFKAEVKDGMNLFGIIEIENKLGSKIIYSGEAYYLMFEGRGILNNISQGIVVDGYFKNGKANGYAVISNKKTNDRYEGEVVGGLKNGRGVFSFGDGRSSLEGIWKDDLFFKNQKVDIRDIDSISKNKTETANVEITDEKEIDHKRSLNLNIDVNPPDIDGVVTLNIKSNNSLISMKVDTEEFGASIDGNYVVARIPKMGRDNIYKIMAIDSFGNKATKEIIVSRDIVSSNSRVINELRPQNISFKNSDSVAIIIGIEKYKKLNKADFANEDARTFYEYAIRSFGIKPDNIKLLVDEGADDVDIYRAIQNWLPLKVKKGKTDVFVFFSGHGLPSQDGKSLFLLPWGVDKDFIEKTAINQQEFISSLKLVQPKSVTMFLDSCYSGQARGGDALLANARPIALKAEETSYPSNFTVITASAPDQISSSSPDLKHGIFSYYLMKGMEGDADLNKDGKTTVAEMQEYLTDMVGRQAMGMNRKQQPQLHGDPNKVLLTR